MDNLVDEALVTFEDLGLKAEVLEAVKQAGYETPSPIQAKAIPVLLQGENLLGTAQTGTGKTAAFTLPLLSRIEFNRHETSMLVLTPTRELAIQVAEAIQKYAQKLEKINVVPVYGGQDIAIQMRALKRTANIIVATPGRLIDHIKRGSISLNKVKAIVLDEADEMLDMGFMEDVEAILKEIPLNAQRALFSATMPDDVKKIIAEHLGNYLEARIEGKTTTVENIRQRYLLVKAEHKFEALTRILEGETFEGILIFVRTKQSAAELSEKLEAKGFGAAPLSGDLAQTMRERTINRLKIGKLDIIVATDVAARGIDVDRITHVVNYDIPYDTESYVHRIGRTGRAGRSGEAILLITPREKRMLKTIEKATRQPIELMEMPSAEHISEKRILEFQKKIQEKNLEECDEKFLALAHKLTEELHVSFEILAAAAIQMAQKQKPLFPEFDKIILPKEKKGRNDFGLDREKRTRKEDETGVEEGFLRYYLGVGRKDRVTPRDIVGAIAGEADISSSIIGRIKLFDKYSTVELPENLPFETLDILADMRIRGNNAKFRLMTDLQKTSARHFKSDKPGNFKKKERVKKSKKEKSFKEKSGDKPFRKTRRFGRV